MKYIVVSDLHIGSAYFEHRLFLELLDRARPDVAIVLAGDVVDNPPEPLKPADRRMVIRLSEDSLHREVVWVSGNHDDGYVPPVPRNILFVDSFTIGSRLMIAHGSDFDNVLTRNRLFVQLFRAFHRARIVLGARPVHVAAYAKHWRWLYRFLRENVMANAVEMAKEIGVGAVACGHVHFPEECSLDGVRYYNLGSWTERHPYCLLVDKSRICFLRAEEALEQPDWFT